ncbi:MAG: NB-ARC domain-containing protein [Coleofasciculus sp. B1-GNL1-01]|uniref:NB-ARC domain-containing protein n=1 Tax=Coleofasciculus sp. B1-GNL1-01 TaxID=3068484 RepID=UPI0032F72D76
MTSPIPPEFLKTLTDERGVSDTELEALSLVLTGQSTQDEIAQFLGITPIALRKRLGEVYRKFEITGTGPGKLVELKQRLIRAYQTHQTQSARRRDWGEAPDVSVMYGRKEELERLKQWIVKDNSRLVAILGMGGIGKTTLAVNLAQEIEEEFEFIIWRSLRNPLPLDSLLADWLTSLGNQEESDLPTDLNERLSLLRDYLSQHRCLLILDDVETIVRSGDRFGRYSPDYEDYGLLLRQVGETSHQGCVLLCSQETLRDIRRLETTRPSVHSLQLNPLPDDAARQILAENGLTGEEKWESLIRDYQGNPLALKLVAATIKEYFNGDVVEFTNLQTILVDDIFRENLDRQFEKLSDLEKEIIQSLASQDKPLSLRTLQKNNSISFSELLEVLDSLRGRSLIEKTGGDKKKTSEPFFTLQPIIRKYVKTFKLNDL